MSITQINPEFSNIRPKSRSWLTWILRNFMSSRQYNNTRGLDALQIKLHKWETEARPRQKLFVWQWHHSAPIYKYNIATLLHFKTCKFWSTRLLLRQLLQFLTVSAVAVSPLSPQPSSLSMSFCGKNKSRFIPFFFHFFFSQR